MRVPRELAAILTHYDIGKCLSFQRIAQGYVNETWRLKTTAGCYVLKRRRPALSDHATVAAQHTLIDNLRSAGFPAPEFMQTHEGATFLSQGDHAYEVQTYIRGTLCDRTNPAHVVAAARTLGHYHRLVSNFDDPVFHRFQKRYTPSVLQHLLEQLGENSIDQHNAQIQHISQRLGTHIQQLTTRLNQRHELPHLIIHGDYYAENIILEADRVVGVVDYDQANWCARIQEVAEATIYFAQERVPRFQHIVYAGALDLNAVYRFLNAYGDVICLSEAEIQVLPHVIRTIWLCASLDPPLLPRLRFDINLEALHELLTLADWGKDHARDITRIGFEVRLHNKVKP